MAAKSVRRAGRAYCGRERRVTVVDGSGRMAGLLAEQAGLVEQPQEFDIFRQEVFVNPFDDRQVAEQRLVGRRPETVSQGPSEQAGGEHAAAGDGRHKPSAAGSMAVGGRGRRFGMDGDHFQRAACKRRRRFGAGEGVEQIPGTLKVMEPPAVIGVAGEPLFDCFGECRREFAIEVGDEFRFDGRRIGRRSA